MFNWNLIYSIDVLEWTKTNAATGIIGHFALFFCPRIFFFFATEFKFLTPIVDFPPPIPMS